MKKNKKTEKTFSIILNALITFVVIITLIGVYYIYQIKVVKNDYADIFGYTFFEVATGSMSGTIEIGDVVITKITKEVNENDIIVYKEGNSFITHRIIRKDGDVIVTKGDANNAEDLPINNEAVLGTVIKIIPKIGIWKKVILSPEVIGLIVFLIVLLEIFIYYSSKSEEKDD